MRWPWRRCARAGGDDTSAAAVSLVLPHAVVEVMRAESERGLPFETGGVLVGHVDSAGRTLITGVVGPGPHAIRSPTKFTRDGEHSQAEVDRLHRESGGRDDYVGEWHSHPASVGPSGVDVCSMAWIGRNARYRRDQPLLIIMQRTRMREWRPLMYRWIEDRLIEVQFVAEDDVPRL